MNMSKRGFVRISGQPSFDKQFARDWLKANEHDWELPQEIVDKTMTITSLPYILNLKDHKIIGVYGENIEDAALGAVVVMGIIGVMVLMVKWITTFKEKQMKYALWALASMTLMLLAVSLIALYILPDIAEKWDQVLIGGGLVLGIIGIMSLMVYLMGKMKADSFQGRNAAVCEQYR